MIVMILVFFVYCVDVPVEYRVANCRRLERLSFASAVSFHISPGFYVSFANGRRSQPEVSVDVTDGRKAQVAGGGAWQVA